MSTSADQVARLLALIPYLQARPGVSLAETAATFSVSRNQLVGDLWVAYMCGLPGRMPGDLIEVDMDAVEQEGVIRLSNADILAAPLRLDPYQVGTLLLGLRAVREVAGPQTYAAIDSAMAKLAAMSWQDGPSAAVSIATGDEQVREQLADATQRGQRARLTYDGGARAETTTPLVDPYRLAVRDGYAYLDAWSVDRGDWRSYRLDRVVAVEVTGEPAAAHGEPPVRENWLSDAAVADVTLRVGASARWIAEYFPGATVAGDLVTLRVSDPGWLRQLVLRLGEDAEVVDPVAAQDAAVLAARDALAVYAQWDDRLPDRG